MESARKAVIAGASGLIGSQLLSIILQRTDYHEVLALVRKELPLSNKKLVQLIVDFDNLKNHANDINADVVFCCLGSTRKKTPDLGEYRKIDHDYPLALAEIANTNNIPQYHIISAIGADAASSNFYSKMKGETEADLLALNLQCLHIWQPSLLTGGRKEFRLGEVIATALMKIIDPLLIGGLKKYKSIAANTVAMAMYNTSLIREEGVFVHPSNHIERLA